MRTLMFLFSLGLLGYGAWWVGTNHPEVKNKVEDWLHTGYFHTLEVRYTAEQIMDSHRRDLLKTNQHKYLEPSLKFYPYLLMEVKYNITDEKTREGVMIWDLTDGEMVIDAQDWEKTHGFGDCIKANTTRQEFKIINILARKGGSIDRDGLIKALHIENEILDAWIDSCRKKKLIVQNGNRYRLHLESAKLKTIPQTRLNERLVTKPFRNADRLSKRFSDFQIERLTKAAFGNDFAIRQTTDVFLPVHSISVQNPDGSIHTSLWNALNGQPLSSTL